jgi:hypothetical protein
MWRAGGRNESDTLELEHLLRDAGAFEMTDVNRIERPAEKTQPPLRHARRSPWLQ